MMNSFFENWNKYYLSLDGEFLSLYDLKHTTVPFFVLPTNDILSLKLEQAGSTGAFGASNVMEDLYNVIIFTKPGDELIMRFQDSGSRVAWAYAIGEIIKKKKSSYGSSSQEVTNIQNLTESIKKRFSMRTISSSSDSSVGKVVTERKGVAVPVKRRGSIVAAPPRSASRNSVLLPQITNQSPGPVGGKLGLDSGLVGKNNLPGLDNNAMAKLAKLGEKQSGGWLGRG